MLEGPGPYNRDLDGSEADKMRDLRREDRVREMRQGEMWKGAVPWLGLCTSILMVIAAGVLYWGVDKALTQYIEDAKTLPPQTVEVEKIVEVEKDCPACQAQPKGILFQLVKIDGKARCILFAGDGSKADIPDSACPALVQGLLSGGTP